MILYAFVPMLPGLGQPIKKLRGNIMIRKHIIVHGRVQGVGFRYIASSIAAGCHVTGWVRNQYDGTVEIEVQGADHRVALFLQEIRQGNRFARVDKLDVCDIETVSVEKEKDFRIKY